MARRLEIELTPVLTLLFLLDRILETLGFFVPVKMILYTGSLSVFYFLSVNSFNISSVASSLITK